MQGFFLYILRSCIVLPQFYITLIIINDNRQPAVDILDVETEKNDLLY